MMAYPWKRYARENFFRQELLPEGFWYRITVITVFFVTMMVAWSGDEDKF